MICGNILKVKESVKNIVEAKKENQREVKLICVTKGRTVEEIREAINCGITDIGENKVQEAKEKFQMLEPPGNIKWHMIGHLQTNKARDAVKIFDLIHSVDSARLAVEMDKEAKKINKVQDILIEVNTSGETAKFGVDPENLTELVKEAIGLNSINLKGLMTMAPVVKNKEDARSYFRKLRECREAVNVFLYTLTPHYLPLTTLSMGMSQDYEAAVEEGSTMVRIGTAIFEG